MLYSLSQGCKKGKGLKGETTMALVVQTNTLALNSQKNLSKATSSMNQAMERLSTGYKINRAADDAAGLYVASNMTSQIGGSEKARDNANIGINMLQTAEGSLTTIQDNLQRIRDLTVQAGNQVYSAESLAAMQMEVDARLAEITRIADVAEFNGLKLLSHDGSMGDVTLQVGANSNAAENTITLTDVFTDTTVTAAGLDVGSSKYEKAFTGGDTNQIANAQAYLSAIDVALETVATKRSKIGAFQNRLNSAIDTLTVNIENLSAARSTIQDTDVAVESSNYIKNQILQQSTTAMLSAANQAPQVALSLIG